MQIDKRKLTQTGKQQNIEPIDKDALWDKIQAQRGLPPAKDGWRIQLGQYWQWSIAASVALLIIAAVAFWPKQQNNSNYTLADFFPEYTAEAQRYQQLIKEKKSDLSFSDLDPSKYQDIFNELALLEEIHQGFLQDLPAYGDEERLLQILTKYYEQKIKMLDRLSREIQKQNTNNDDDEVLL